MENFDVINHPVEAEPIYPKSQKHVFGKKIYTFTGLQILELKRLSNKGESEKFKYSKSTMCRILRLMYPDISLSEAFKISESIIEA